MQGVTHHWETLGEGDVSIFSNKYLKKQGRGMGLKLSQLLAQKSPNTLGPVHSSVATGGPLGL